MRQREKSDILSKNWENAEDIKKKIIKKDDETLQYQISWQRSENQLPG